ncbi:MAG: hypothetical protein WC455_12215 [Dehalococcoidia bacterium]|jgi:hypothetical protein
MALVLIDTQTVHDVTISGTVFKVKAADGRQYLKLLRVMTGVTVQDESATLSKSSWNDALDILDDRVVEIDGFTNKRQTLEQMSGMDISVLTAEVMRLSAPSEAEVKN